jgi:hypothetical protein
MESSTNPRILQFRLLASWQRLSLTLRLAHSVATSHCCSSGGWRRMSWRYGSLFLLTSAKLWGLWGEQLRFLRIRASMWGIFVEPLPPVPITGSLILHFISGNEPFHVALCLSGVALFIESLDTSDRCLPLPVLCSQWLSSVLTPQWTR